MSKSSCVRKLSLLTAFLLMLCGYVLLNAASASAGVPAGAPGSTVGANQCDLPTACIRDAYQSENTIVVVFHEPARSRGNDSYRIRSDQLGQFSSNDTQSEYRLYNIQPNRAYTIVIEGCRWDASWPRQDTCDGHWSNPVTVYTTTPVIAQRADEAHRTSDIMITQPNTGFYQTFTNNVALYCREVNVYNPAVGNTRHQCTAAYFVYGEIRNRWASMNWEMGCLGYPASDEMSWGTGHDRISYFVHGWISWRSDTGATTASCQGGSVGPYHLQFANSGKCLHDPTIGGRWGYNLDQLPCTNRADELWYLDYANNFAYQIRNAATGMCVNIAGVNNATGVGYNYGTRIIAWPCGPYPNEYFIKTTNQNGYVAPGGYQFITAQYAPSMVLNVYGNYTYDGAPIILWGGGPYPNEYVRIY